MARRIKITGMVDPHTHLRDLDWSHKATFASETAAALAGGYWAVFDMPNTPPTTTTPEALDHKLERFAQTALCDYGVYYGASQSDNTASFAGLHGVCGLKIFCNATTGDLLVEDQALRDSIYAAWDASKIIAVHAEGDTVREILDLVRKHRKRTHFLHISTADEIAMLADAKAESLPVTVGVCPHHLYLTDEDLSTLGAFGLMKPELKTPADREALWDAINDGIVDVVESDHAPHTLEEKQSERPPYGVPGLETTLPLLITAVHDGRITLEQAVELVSVNPRRIWGLSAPPETYALVDLDESYVIDRATLKSACGWSPFEGMRVRGRVIETWLRGERVYDGEIVTVTAGSGCNLFA